MSITQPLLLGDRTSFESRQRRDCLTSTTNNKDYRKFLRSLLLREVPFVLDLDHPSRVSILMVQRFTSRRGKGGFLHRIRTFGVCMPMILVKIMRLLSVNYFYVYDKIRMGNRCDRTWRRCCGRSWKSPREPGGSSRDGGDTFLSIWLSLFLVSSESLFEP